jgi:transcriptional regulator with XRE-family HTH domain
MAHQLNAIALRKVAAKLGDETDYRIAKRSGVARATLSRLVNGQGEPSITTLMRLAACYRVSVESLVYEPSLTPALAA